MILRCIAVLLRSRFYLMGLVGWLIIAQHYPIDWALPVYAAY